MGKFLYAGPPIAENYVNLGSERGWSLDAYRMTETSDGRPHWITYKLWTPFGVEIVDAAKYPKQPAYYLITGGTGWIPKNSSTINAAWRRLWHQDKELKEWARLRCKAYGLSLEAGRARKPGESPEEAAARGIRVVAPSGKDA